MWRIRGYGYKFPKREDKPKMTMWPFKKSKLRNMCYRETKQAELDWMCAQAQKEGQRVFDRLCEDYKKILDENLELKLRVSRLEKSRWTM